MMSKAERFSYPKSIQRRIPHARTAVELRPWVKTPDALPRHDRYHRTGILWEGRFTACPVQSDEHLLRCYR